MNGAGINLVRTGTWTSFRNVMYVDGIAYEEVMRAIDAFILTAKRFDIEVVFNFFAFTPEMWEGKNPYLDPVCVEAQKRYISAICIKTCGEYECLMGRYKTSLQCAILQRFSGALSPTGTNMSSGNGENGLGMNMGNIESLQEKWNLSADELSSFEDVTLPSDADLQVIQERDEVPHPPAKRIKALMAMDYGLFTNHVLNMWARELAGTIRAIAPGQLVAIGQDHPTSGRRPPSLFSRQVYGLYHGTHMVAA